MCRFFIWTHVLLDFIGLAMSCLVWWSLISLAISCSISIRSSISSLTKWDADLLAFRCDSILRYLKRTQPIKDKENNVRSRRVGSNINECQRKDVRWWWWMFVGWYLSSKCLDQPLILRIKFEPITLDWCTLGILLLGQIWILYIQSLEFKSNSLIVWFIL